jgi:hypothetical protein
MEWKEDWRTTLTLMPFVHTSMLSAQCTARKQHTHTPRDTHSMQHHADMMQLQSRERFVNPRVQG